MSNKNDNCPNCGGLGVVTAQCQDCDGTGSRSRYEKNIATPKKSEKDIVSDAIKDSLFWKNEYDKTVASYQSILSRLTEALGLGNVSMNDAIDYARRCKRNVETLVLEVEKLNHDLETLKDMEND